MHSGAMLGAHPQTQAGPDAGGQLGDHLELLANIGQDFAASLDIDETLNRALARIAEYLGAEAASLFLLDDREQALACRACFGPADIVGLRLRPDEGIVGRSVQENVCQMVRDVRLDPDFAKSVDAHTGFTTRSVLCAPMSVKDRRVGAIELLNKRGGDGLYEDHDRHILQALASSAALAIINTRLTAALIEQEKVRRELELAAEIQRSFLPKRSLPNFPVCGLNVPARGVSGDFFDVLPLEDGRVCFNVGDVSGKGMNAALLMAKTSSLYHCLCKTTRDPGELLSVINEELCETGTRGMFVTMVGGIFDPATGMVRFANAGHEPPLHQTCDGLFHAYPASAPPLGIVPDIVAGAAYPVSEVALDGGSFYVFTDGVTEGRVSPGNQLGVEGFKALVGEHQSKPPLQRITAIADCLDRPGTVLHDDLTVLAIEALTGNTAQ